MTNPPENTELTDLYMTYMYDGRIYEIDHLGITHPENAGEFAVYRDHTMLAWFSTTIEPFPRRSELRLLAIEAVAEMDEEDDEDEAMVCGCASGSCYCDDSLILIEGV